MKPNPGYCPEHLRGTEKRVRVKLRNGSHPQDAWPADGRGALRWTLRNWPFDVVEYEEAS